jgi:hypothetical protein
MNCSLDGQLSEHSSWAGSSREFTRRKARDGEPGAHNSYFCAGTRREKPLDSALQGGIQYGAERGRRATRTSCKRADVSQFGRMAHHTTERTVHLSFNGFWSGRSTVQDEVATR